MHNYKKLIWTAVVILLIMAGVSFIFLKDASVTNRDDESVLDQLKNQTGYIRTVGEEEYQFFRNLVVRDLEENLSEEEIEQKTKEKINRVNAEFILGNQMGLCHAYSFESFQRDMENENNQRKIKKENDEVFYGPEEFDLISYYNYVSQNLKLSMVSYIMENAYQEVNDGAKAYFEENKEKYRTIESIEYLLSEEGTTEEKTLLRQDMSSLEKTDSELFEFLYYGEEGEVLSYERNGASRKAEIVSIHYESLTYSENAEEVMRDYITNVYLEDLIQKVEEESPVEFQVY